MKSNVQSQIRSTVQLMIMPVLALVASAPLLAIAQTPTSIGPHASQTPFGLGGSGVYATGKVEIGEQRTLGVTGASAYGLGGSGIDGTAEQQGEVQSASVSVKKTFGLGGSGFDGSDTDGLGGSGFNAPPEGTFGLGGSGVDSPAGGTTRELGGSGLVAKAVHGAFGLGGSGVDGPGNTGTEGLGGSGVSTYIIPEALGLGGSGIDGPAPVDTLGLGGSGLATPAEGEIFGLGGSGTDGADGNDRFSPSAVQILSCSDIDLVNPNLAVVGRVDGIDETSGDLKVLGHSLRSPAARVPQDIQIGDYLAVEGFSLDVGLIYATAIRNCEESYVAGASLVFLKAASRTTPDNRGRLFVGDVTIDLNSIGAAVVLESASAIPAFYGTQPTHGGVLLVTGTL
jgi:hypothetical protein